MLTEPAERIDHFSPDPAGDFAFFITANDASGSIFGVRASTCPSTIAIWAGIDNMEEFQEFV